MICPLTKIVHVAVEICRQLIETYNILGGGGGGESIDFWNRGANNVLIWGSKIFCGLKFQGLKSAISKF